MVFQWTHSKCILGSLMTHTVRSIFHAGQVDIKCFIWVENRKFTKFQMKLLKVLFYQIADWKEVFMLFDRDEDGVLSFQELQVVMKSMGQRPSGWWAEWRTSDYSHHVYLGIEEDLLARVRAVSEDYVYDTVEFNEFLQLMSKQQETAFTRQDLMASFK